MGCCFFRLLFFSLLILLPYSASAQKETGSITGTITDLDVSPLPGVTVIASSLSLIGGSATSLTDQDGAYRFLALAPGIYQIEARLQGFQIVIRKDVPVTV